MAKDREYIRVTGTIPVHYQAYDETNEAEEWERFFIDVEPRDEFESSLIELLYDLHQKLDRIVEHLAARDGFKLPEAKEVTISGGGMSFKCADRFAKGDILKIRVFLPGRGRLLKLKSEVVRCSTEEDGSYLVAVKFMDLEEKDRDKLIGYVFARQREELRNRNE